MNHSVEQKRQPEVAVLIPCYNESATIAKVVTDFKRVLPDASIYVYDNNSTDNTAELARRAGAIVRFEPRQGKGNVVRSMFQDIDADAYLMVDGDDTYPAEAAPEMVQKILDGYDMVIGDRLTSTYFTENKRHFHNMGNRVVRGSINTLFHAHLTDIMTGYRAMSYPFVKTYPALSQGFEIETEMTIHALDKNVKITTIPVEYRDRPEGSVSKLNTISDGMKVLDTIFHMIREYKPLPFFGWTGAVIALVGLVLMIPIFIEFWHTGTVARFPTFFGAFILILIGLLFFFTGIILDILAKSDRKQYNVESNIVCDMRTYALQTQDDPESDGHISHDNAKGSQA